MSNALVRRDGLALPTSEDATQMAFIMLVLKNLISFTSPDALALSVLHASRDLKLDKKTVEKYLKPMMSHSGTAFPPGFM